MKTIKRMISDFIVVGYAGSLMLTTLVFSLLAANIIHREEMGICA